MTKEILLTALVLAPIVSTIALMPYYRQLDGIAIVSLILHRLDKSKYTVINDVIYQHWKKIN